MTIKKRDGKIGFVADPKGNTIRISGEKAGRKNLKKVVDKRWGNVIIYKSCRFRQHKKNFDNWTIDNNPWKFLKEKNFWEQRRLRTRYRYSESLLFGIDVSGHWRSQWSEKRMFRAVAVEHPHWKINENNSKRDELASS